MKNLIYSAITMAIVLSACNTKSKEAAPETSTQTTTSEQLYSCPMHPEVKGNKGDKCPKCNMDLTVPVTTNETANPK